MNPWLQALVAIASVLFGGGGLVAILNALTGRRGRRADVLERLSDSQLKWVEQFQEEAHAARLEAAEARREVAEVRREMGELRREAEGLARDLRNLRGAILAPDMTLARLRALVGGDSANGR